MSFSVNRGTSLFVVSLGEAAATPVLLLRGLVRTRRSARHAVGARLSAVGLVQDLQKPVEVLLVLTGDALERLFDLGIADVLREILKLHHFELFGVQQILEEKKLPLRELAHCLTSVRQKF